MTALAPDPAAAKATGTLIEVRDLEVHYALHGTFRSRLTGRGGGSVKAVDGVSFDLREGEVLGLVGESGSGKTTLGRSLLGLVRPTGGSVKLRGRELAGLPESRLRPLRRHLQMVFQDPHASLNPAMTLETALAHPLQIHGLTKSAAETRAKVLETLELVGLAPAEDFAARYPADLSGGQKQRAAIARALARRPSVVLLDDALSAVDTHTEAAILRGLGTALAGRTTRIASHRLSAVRDAGWILVLDEGRVVEQGRHDELVALGGRYASLVRRQRLEEDVEEVAAPPEPQGAQHAPA
jgi:peptide/nickel transport system ATP-binding protein